MDKINFSVVLSLIFTQAVSYKFMWAMDTAKCQICRTVLGRPHIYLTFNLVVMQRKDMSALRRLIVCPGVSDPQISST